MIPKLLIAHKFDSPDEAADEKYGRRNNRLAEKKMNRKTVLILLCQHVQVMDKR